MFAYNSSMRLAAPQPRRHKVLMSFRHWNAWDVIFFDTDRMRTPLPRRARFNSDEALIEFAQRAGGIKMSEDRQILDMMIQRKTGEITLNLTDEQYTKLYRRFRHRIEQFERDLESLTQSIGYTDPSPAQAHQGERDL